jgi:probable HAF family extracellular repeat protein
VDRSEQDQARAHPTIDIGALAADGSQANAINSAGQVVGSALMPDGSSRAFVWDATNGMRDLNAVLPIGPTWTLTSAIGINPSGQVVGAAQIDPITGLDHTFIGLTTVSSGSPPNPNPAPALTVLSPASSAAGGGAFTLTVSGSGFVSRSQVQWKGLPRTTTFVSSTQLTTTLQAADVASAGAVEVAVVSPAPGGGISAPQVFFITASGAAVTGSSSATSANPQGSARASTGGSGVGTSGSLTATASGNGTVTVAQYAADPISQPGPNCTSNYFDLHVSSNSNFTGLVLVDCNLTGLSGTTGYGILYWWRGAVWEQAGPQKYDPSTNCTTVTISAFNASPGLLQLAGTPFAVVVDPHSADHHTCGD